MPFKSVFITPLSDVASTDKEGVGTLRFENNKVYKYVKYVHGTGSLDVVAGDMAVYTDESAEEVTADVSDISAQEIGAGVFVADVDETDRYCWIQTTGPATLNQAIGGSAGDGDPLTAVGASDKALTKAAESDTAAVYKPVCATAVDASAKTVLLHCPW